MWFEDLMGFEEKNPEETIKKIILKNGLLSSTESDREFIVGDLEIKSLRELQQEVSKIQPYGQSRLSSINWDVKKTIEYSENKNSLFQVASQFNLLEMASPQITPEEGVGIYELDYTQGPACAIAAGAATIYRNYLIDVNGKKGQSKNNQIDCSEELAKFFDNTDERLWRIENGYLFATEDGLIEITEKLKSLSEEEYENVKGLLKFGIVWNTEVTSKNKLIKNNIPFMKSKTEHGHLISQIFCSALPISYSPHSKFLWKEFSKLVLESAYEATLCTAIINNNRTKQREPVFLTYLGGGAFGNEEHIIKDSMHKALTKYKDYNLDVILIEYN